MRTQIQKERSVTSTDRPSRGEQQVGSLSREELMKKMQEAGTPGPAHQFLESFVGNWKAEVTCWMDPNDPPVVSQATSKIEWILEKHFIDEEFHGEMMRTPFTRRSIMGFDNTKQKFTSVWVDSLHTSMCTSEGKGDTPNKVIALEGKMDCPATGRKAVLFKQVFRVLSKVKFFFALLNDGQRTMEIEYTRQCREITGSYQSCCQSTHGG